MYWKLICYSANPLKAEITLHLPSLLHIDMGACQACGKRACTLLQRHVYGEALEHYGKPSKWVNTECKRIIRNMVVKNPPQPDADRRNNMVRIYHMFVCLQMCGRQQMKMDHDGISLQANHLFSDMRKDCLLLSEQN